ncbi:hypothetical protein ACSLBF_10950 [Pseudoalteromonas sp. T1lg65]|uniref:hypothetical protein n=1 Tax=Pseudoalteromonas sp. T1lg65 TaxID=2077101 RepID=UPI003F7A9A6F
MRNVFKVFVLLMGLFSYSSATANTPTQQLGSCLVDSLNGKERKNLAKWIYFGMGAHPEIKDFMSASANTINESDKYVGKLITKILTEDCPKELVAAHQADPLAIQKAFELVGQAAMQELMSNQETMQALSNYATYVDQEKLSKTLGN